VSGTLFASLITLIFIWRMIEVLQQFLFAGSVGKGKWQTNCKDAFVNLSSGVRHEIAYVIVSPVYRKEEKPAVSSAVAYRRMRSW